jgi:hypothetical protein
VKRQCLATIARMLHFNSADTLRSVLEDLPAAGLVAALLGARDAAVAAYGMQVGRHTLKSPCSRQSELVLANITLLILCVIRSAL